ncbi:hypothetical protein [Streptantibioticus ferralitis]|uniref:Uncharacterized protein n=1 Tax=Streptantibioticus ferralitis TaxID=236510 RepID=A0ABT5YSP6_9ACTN|nr:hypothetical protein [Streptantibioticus ferralitis]MDF2254356.1 hypothetical protein [Streptantibioticus ferralitis]
MSDPTPLAQADAMIEKAWGRPIADLQALAVRRPVQDPLLTAAMHLRSALVVSNNAVAVHQDRLHALTRPGYVPPFYDLERTTRAATELRVAQAESLTALRGIGYLIEAREAATAHSVPGVRLAQAAVARSTQARPALGHPPDRPGPTATTGPRAATIGPRR